MEEEKVKQEKPKNEDKTKNEDKVKQDKFKKRTKLAIAGSYILIVILFILLLVFRCQCEMGTPPNSTDLEKGSIEFINPKADRDLQNEVNKAVEQGMFNVFMNTDIIFKDGKSKGNLLIQNVDTNPFPVFVEIYTKDTNELIYKSHEIPVGYKIEEAKLNKTLDKGTYKCVAYFYVIDESKEVKNKIGLNCNITIQN